MNKYKGKKQIASSAIRRRGGAKKSLGQNFLKSVLALNKIIEVGEIKPDDIILEIGPGKGALTAKLLEKAGTVVAVEKDKELINFLQERFKTEIENKKLILIEEDILEFLLARAVLASGYKIIANIPYNITGAILKKFLTEEKQPEQMVLMVQHEVARRIMANDKKESLLSISVKAYGEPKLIMKVPARYFQPAPKVDSAVILIKNISKGKFISPQPSPYKGERVKIQGGGESSAPSAILEEKFWKILHAGFAHKRKVLINNLRGFDKNIDWVEVFDKLNIQNTARAEDLSVQHWLSLVLLINQ